MATASDFKSWAVPNLVMPLGGRDGVVRDFVVRPPSVDDAAKVLACAIRGEVKLGMVEGPIPDDVQAVLDTIGPDEHPSLGEAYQEMVDAEVGQITIDRMIYYSIFYWARGEEYADTLARILWTPRDPAADIDAQDAEEPAPKGS